MSNRGFQESFRGVLGQHRVPSSSPEEVFKGGLEACHGGVSRKSQGGPRGGSQREASGGFRTNLRPLSSRMLTQLLWSLKSHGREKAAGVPHLPPPPPHPPPRLAFGGCKEGKGRFHTRTLNPER